MTKFSFSALLVFLLLSFFPFNTAQAAEKPKDARVDNSNSIRADIATSPGGTTYAEGTDVDTHTTNGSGGRDSFLLDEAGVYTFTGTLSSGGGDATDVIPIRLGAGYFMDQYSLTKTGGSDHGGNSFYVEETSGSGYNATYAFGSGNIDTNLTAEFYNFFAGRGLSTGLTYSISITVSATAVDEPT